MSKTRILMTIDDIQAGRLRVVVKTDDNGQLERVSVETPGRDALDNERWDSDFHLTWSGELKTKDGDLEMSRRNARLLLAIFTELTKLTDEGES